MKIFTLPTNCRKPIFAFLAVLFCLTMKTEVGFGQTANQYTFSTNATSSLASASDLNGNAIDMSTGTTQLVGANQDDAASAVTSIGFNFTFFGAVYTTFTASSNGGIRLGGNISTNIIGTSFPVTGQPILAPYLQDIRTSTTGKIHYKLIGTAPNRTLVIEFLNMGINFSNTTANGTFQVRLYEQTNVIEYVYGAMAVGSIANGGGSNADARTAVIGFSNTTGVNNEFSVNQSTYATTTAAAPITNTNAATGNITGLNSASNGSRRAFIFTPALPYRAQFLSMSTGSTTWCAGEVRNVTVTIKNIGTATWTNPGPPAVNIGAKWSADAVDYPFRVSALNLAPGATGTFTIPITAPATTGANTLLFDVVKEGDCWFRLNNGSCGPGNLNVFTSANQTINATPTPSFTTSPTATTCSGTDVTYTTQSGQSNYIWLVPGTLGTDYTITSGGIGTTNNTVTLKWLTAGSKTVTVNYSAGSCSGATAASSATTVSIRPTPSFTALPTAITCSGTDVTYTTQSGQSNYVWSVPGTLGTDYTITSGGIGTTSNTVTLKWLTAGSKTVTVNYTTGSCNGLTAASSATTVSLRPTPTFTVSPGATTCSGTDVTYTTQSGQSSYIWSVPGTLGTDYTITSGGIGTTNNTVILKWLTAGSKTVTVNYTTGSCNGLTAASSATTVSITPTPTFTTSPSAATCSGTDVTYTTQAGQTNYVWVVPGTLGTDYTITSGGIGTTSNTVTLKWLTAGSKTVTVNYTTGSCNGLTAASSATTVSLSPTVFIGSAIPAICQGGTTGALSGTFGGGATGAIWDDGGAGGTFTNNTGSTPNTATYTASVTAPSTVTLTLTTTGGSCGTVSNSKTVTVYQSVTITANPGPALQTVCATSTVIYTVAATGDGLTYQWFKDGSLINNGGNKSGATTSTLTITGVALIDDGDYTVVVSGTSPCSSVTSTPPAHLDVDQRATFTVQPVTPQTVCQGDTYNVSATANGTVVTAKWNKGATFYANATTAGNVYSLAIPNVQPSDAGSYQLVLDDGTSGCTASNSNIAVLNISVTSVGGSVGSDATVCYGTNSGTLTLSGYTGVIQRWESSTDNFGSVINPIANTSASQNYTNLTQTTQYRAVVQSGVCPPANSAFATITVNPVVDFGAITTGDETICNGGDPSNITLSTAPTGGAGTFTYQWYYQDGAPTCPTGTSTAGWTTISGATGSSYDPPAGLTGSRTYAVQVDATGTPDCSVATWAGSCRKVTVNAAVNYGTIASGDQTICNGGDPSNIILSTAPTGGAGTFTYQWYYQDGVVACPTGTSTSGWTSIPGATTNSYDPPAGLIASRTYALQVDPTGTQDCGPATWTGNCRKVTVNAIVNYGTVTNGDETICNGGNPSNITLSTPPTGGAGTFTYQWYYQDGVVACPTGTSTTGWTLIAGAITNSYDPPAGLAGSRTYAVLVDATGSPDCGVPTWASNCRKVTVLAVLNFGTIASGDETICNGGDPSNIILSTAPAGGSGTFTYQWYYKDGISACPTGTSTTGWTLIAGATTDSYDPPAGLITSRTYAVQVDPTGSPDCSVATWAGNCRKVTVNATVGYGTVANGDQTICNGGDPSNIILSTAPTGGSGTFTYQWYYQDGVIACPTGTSTSGWTAIASATGNSYDPPAGLTGSRTYAVQVDATGSPDCGVATWASNCRKVTVNAAVTFGTVASGDETICNGGDPSGITLSAAPTGGSGTFSYQWYFQNGSVACPTGTSTTGWTSIAGATTSTYNPPTGLTGTRTYAVQVDATGTPDCSVATWASGCRKVTVNAAVNFGTISNGDQTICNGDDPANITLSTQPSGGAGSFTFQWYYRDGVAAGCPTGTSTTGWTIIAGATTNSYDPPAGLTGSRTYALQVDPTGAQDCGIATWASGCRKVTVNAVVSYGTVASGNQTICYAGDPASIGFSPAPTGGSGTFTYQWYYQDGLVVCPTGTSTTGWTSVGAANGGQTATYNPPTGLTNSRTYAVIVDPTGTPDCGVASWAGSCRQVTVLPILNYGTVATGNESMCAGGNPAIINLSTTPSGGNGTFTYQWYYQDGLVSCPTGNTTGWTSIAGATSNSYDPPAGIPNSRTYALRVTPTGTNGCGTPTWASNCRQVTVFPLPVPVLTSSNDPVCVGVNVTYTTDAGQTNYIWIFNGVAGTDYTIISGGNSTSNTAVVTWLTSGNKTVTINYTNNNGCVASTATSNTIEVDALPSGTFTATENSGNAANDNIICTGAPVTFTAPAGNGSYIFKVGPTVVQTGTSNTYSSSSLTDGASVTVDVANASNCGVTFGPIVISVKPLPTPTLTSDKTSICPGDNVTFTAGGGTNYNFKVNGSSVQSGASNTYSSTTLTNGASVTVDVTNSNGCIATFSPAIVISVNAVPSGTLAATENSGTANDNKICAGSSVTFTATPLVTGYNYNFKVNGASVQSSPTNTYTTTTLTNGQVVTVDVTNATSCTSSFGPAQVITVSPLPTGTLTATETSGTPNNNEICAGSPVKFTATAGFSNYKFFINANPTPIQNGITNTYTSSTLANGDVVSVVVTNTSGCSSTFNTITITVSPLPTGTLTPSTTTICKNDNIDFTATAGFANYNFRRNGTSFQNGASNTASYSNFNNNDVVTVDVSNATGCVGTFGPLTITVNPLPTGTLVGVETSGIANNDSTICTGANVIFTATAGFSNYNFKLNGTTAQFGASNTYPNNTLADGDKVTVEVTNSTNCVASFNSVTITVHTLPAVAAITGASQVCVGNTITLTDVTNGGTWSSDNSSAATVNASGDVTGVAAGTANILYKVSNANGCDSTVSKTITVNALPIVAPITGIINLCTSEPPIYSTSQLSDATNGGTWSSSNTGVATIDASGIVTAGTSPGSSTISYTVTDANGCSATAVTTVTVSSSPSVAPITTTAPSFDVCVNSAITVKDATLNGVWSSDNTAVATVSSTGVVTGVAAGTAIISYTITTTCNTTVASTQIITVHALPTATIGGTTSVCKGGTSPDITFTGADGNSPYTFTYKINGGSNQTVTTTSGNSVTVSAPTGTAGIFTYSLVSVSDSYGCSQAQTGSAVITVNTLPTATVSGTTSVCIASTSPNITFTGANGTAPYTFTYTVNGGSPLSVISVGNIATVPVSTATAGVYTYDLVSVQDASTTACSQTQTGSAVVTVTVASVGGSVTADATVCAGTNSGTLTLSGQTGNIIRWESSTDNFTTITTITNTLPTLNYSNLSTTTKFRAVVQSGSCSIANSSPATITVNPASVGGTVASAQTICSGTAPPSLVLSGNTGTVVKWQKSIDAAFTTPIDIAGTNSLTTLPSGAIGTLTATTYFRAVVQSGTCIIATSVPVKITVNPAPTATISGPANVCKNATPAPVITFTGANGTAPYTFTYTVTGTPGNQTVISTGNTATVAIPVGTVTSYTYTLVSVKDNSTTLCTSTITGQSVTVAVNDIPTISVTPTSSTICQSTIQSLTATSAGTPTTGNPTFTGATGVSIPDATTFFGVNPGEVNTPVTVSGIPANAVITNISVTLNIAHLNDGDLNFNIKGPNGSILNLVNRKGGTGDNFTNTVIAMTGGIVFPASGGAPFTNTYQPNASIGIGPGGNTSNVTNFSNLIGATNGNGTWRLYAEDAVDNSIGGTISSWSIKVDYQVPVSNPVTWSPFTDLYTDAGATTAYTGQSLTTVYVSPSTSGTKTYTATATNGAGCSATAQATINVGAPPTVTIAANYCLVPGQVVLSTTANQTVTYLWSNGKTTDTIHVDESGDYSVTVTNAQGCKGFATISVSKELVTNGDFEAGNTGFTSGYNYKPDINGAQLVPAGQGELYDDNGNNGYSITPDGHNVHTDFWGYDHTAGDGTGNFMAVNGHDGVSAWQETINVLPNTDYYFSAWGRSLNDKGPFARLQFNVNGFQVGTIDSLKSYDHNSGSVGWTRFYGTWHSGATITSAVITITDLESQHGGNDYGLDDISFATLSTFLILESADGTDHQSVCVNSPIVSIVYSFGNGNSNPTVSGLPAGVTASFSGDKVTLSGTPTVVGNYTYSITTTGCSPFTVTGTINAQGQTITVNAGSNAAQTVCINTAINPIVYTVGGTGTGAKVKGLPTGVTGTYNAGAKTFTISGIPTVAGIFKDTVITTGTCRPDTAYGTITVQNQGITAVNPTDTLQTVCINNGINPITYNLTGTATGATVTGLPAGITGFVSGSPGNFSYIISGTPTVSGTFNYTITTTGTCSPAAKTTGIITVSPNAVITRTSAAGTDAQTVCINSPITDITYSITGSGNNASITAGALPAGVTGTYNAGVFKITGTPTVTGTFNYTITATGGCDPVTIDGQIIVQQSTITLTSGTASPTLCLGSTLINIVYTISGGATGATINWTTVAPPGITAGPTAGNTFTITGTPTALGTYGYTVSTTGGCTPAATATGTITVNNGTVGGTLPALTSKCIGDPATSILNLTGSTGTVQRWEQSTDGGTTWTNIANTTTTLAYSGLTVPTQFRALVKSGSCIAEYSTVALIGLHNYWTGGTSRDWNVASNWSDNQVASSTCNLVMIPSGTLNSPQLTTDVTVPGITIASGANVELNGKTLTINGTFTGSTTGYIKGSATSGIVIGGNAGTLYFDPSNNILQTLTINNSKTAALGNALNITAGSTPGIVTANGTLNTNDNLTLKSDLNGTAMVGQSSGNISGNVTVERFVPARRAWRFMSTPLYSSPQTIRDAWQEGVTNTAIDYASNLDPHPGYGTHITGNNDYTLGYDVNTTSNLSLKVWGTNTWLSTEPVTISDNILKYPAYCLFVRGSRAVHLEWGVYSPVDNTTLRMKGQLNERGTGGNKFTQAFTSVAAEQFLFVGNPYASSIDLNTTLTHTNDVYPNKFWVWDPKINGNYDVGGYVSYSNGIWTPSGTGSYPTGSGNPAIIQSGQAFMVQANGSTSNPSVEFQQPDKSTTQNNVFGKAANVEPIPVIYTNLTLPAASGSQLIDGVAAGFGDKFSSSVDADDAQKLWNFDENIALTRNGHSLAIEFRPMPVFTDTLFYKLYLRQQPYVLQVFMQNLPASTPIQAWLVDKYLNTKTAIGLKDTMLYNFTPNTDTNSYRNRFMIVFKRVLLATPTPGQTPIATGQVTTGNESGSVAGNAASKVEVYPNPVITGGKVIIKFSNMLKGKYEIKLSNVVGDAVTARTIEHIGGSEAYTVQLDPKWAAGSYLINIIGNNGYSTVTKLVIAK